MKIDFCPYCEKEQKLIGSTVLLNKKDPQGKNIKTKVTSYNCSACSNFIKSETEDEKK